MRIEPKQPFVPRRAADGDAPPVVCRKSVDMRIVERWARTNGKVIADARPNYRVHSKHYWLHLASGLFVFALGLAADFTIGEIRYRWPHKVRWSVMNDVTPAHRLDWKKDTNFWRTDNLAAVELGFSDDGTVYWRLQKR